MEYIGSCLVRVSPEHDPQPSRFWKTHHIIRGFPSPSAGGPALLAGQASGWQSGFRNKSVVHLVAVHFQFLVSIDGTAHFPSVPHFKFSLPPMPNFPFVAVVYISLWPVCASFNTAMARPYGRFLWLWPGRISFILSRPYTRSQVEGTVHVCSGTQRAPSVYVIHPQTYNK